MSMTKFTEEKRKFLKGLKEYKDIVFNRTRRNQIRYFFIQHSFSIKYCAKNGREFVEEHLKLCNQALSGTMENWTPEAVSKLNN